VRCDKLAIEQSEPANPQSRHEVGERDLAGIRGAAEHALTKKAPPSETP
jgi:hypothetical protein